MKIKITLIVRKHDIEIVQTAHTNKGNLQVTGVVCWEVREADN